MPSTYDLEAKTAVSPKCGAAAHKKVEIGMDGTRSFASGQGKQSDNRSRNHASVSMIRTCAGYTASTLPASTYWSEKDLRRFQSRNISDQAVYGSSSNASTSDGHSTDIEIIRTASPFNDYLARCIDSKTNSGESHAAKMTSQNREEAILIQEGKVAGQATLEFFDSSMPASPFGGVTRSSSAIDAQRTIYDVKRVSSKMRRGRSDFKRQRSNRRKSGQSEALMPHFDLQRWDKSSGDILNIYEPEPTFRNVAFTSLRKVWHLVLIAVVVGLLYRYMVKKA